MVIFINVFSTDNRDQLLKYGRGESFIVSQINSKPNSYYLSGHIDRAEKPLLKIQNGSFEMVAANNDGKNKFYYYLNSGDDPLIECTSSTSCSGF